MLLEVKDVSAGYGSGPDILNGVSVAIERGKAYCIIGPNGAGKSTLLKTICGLLRPRGGTIELAGQRIDGLRPDQILTRGVCFVPQDRSLFPDMTVLENLQMGGYTLRDRKQLADRIAAVFAMFPILAERRSQRARTMSGGQQQMLAMGRALLLDPEVILLDEPSVGLAPQIVQQVFDSIARLRSAGKTLVIVEQNARKGLEHADRGYVLDLGATRLEGPAASLLSDPRIEELYLGKRRAEARA
ncbi:MAG: ABC transporter ATP-binding protein [Deltaproteobacteria bacterium]|nr:MAG: ABC transporter ATP-binding protein [Deltaproteobacteria bacterium]